MIISEKTKKINFCESKNPLEDIFESLNQRKKKHNMANVALLVVAAMTTTVAVNDTVLGTIE